MASADDRARWAQEGFGPDDHEGCTQDEAVGLVSQAFGSVVDIRSGQNGQALETRRNGFGGVTTVAAARTKNGPRPPTPAQLSYLRSLLAEHADEAQTTALRVVLNRAREDNNLTGRLVSETIDRLRALPRRRPAPAPDLPDVPAGRYAVPNEEGSLCFYKVDRPTEGQWAGFTFLAVQASDDLHPIKSKPAKAAILAAIAADVFGAAQRYGQQIGRCGRCGRTLTDETSRAFGIGPECRSKF